MQLVENISSHPPRLFQLKPEGNREMPGWMEKRRQKCELLVAKADKELLEWQGAHVGAETDSLVVLGPTPYHRSESCIVHAAIVRAQVIHARWI